MGLGAVKSVDTALNLQLMSECILKTSILSRMDLIVLYATIIVQIESLLDHTDRKHGKEKRFWILDFKSSNH